MNTYLFLSGNSFELKQFENLITFSDAYPDFYDISLDNESQFKSLMQLINIQPPDPIYLNNEDFICVMDISDQLLPEFGKEEFDLFYDQWLSLTGRSSNMDEYGQFIFLNGVSSKMNKSKTRLILLTTDGS